MTHVFITGATGVVGSALVPLFLAEPSTYVTALVRAVDDDALDQRRGALLAFWGDDLPKCDADRLTLVRGDAAAPRLGLSGRGYDALTGQVTHIVHSAASVRLDMTPEEARASCLAPVQGILEFAENGRTSGPLRKLDYVSTLGVAGRMTGLVPETLLTPPGYFTEYERTKAEAETLVAAAIARGLPATIHRPSMVVGHARSGKVIHQQGFHFLCRFLSGEFSHNILPSVRGQCLDVVPCDWVAGIIHWSSRMSETKGRILHLCAGLQRAIELEELVRALVAFRRERGEKVSTPQFIPPPVFLAIARAFRPFVGRERRRRLDQLDWFRPYLGHHQVFANGETLKLLDRSGCPPPPQLREFLSPVLSYAAARANRPPIFDPRKSFGLHSAALGPWQAPGV